jgi:hypothetical protein
VLLREKKIENTTSFQLSSVHGSDQQRKRPHQPPFWQNGCPSQPKISDKPDRRIFPYAPSSACTMTLGDIPLAKFYVTS